MTEELETLRDRIDGLRLCLTVLVSALPNQDEALHKLMKAEQLARQRDLPAGTIEEIADLCETLRG